MSSEDDYEYAPVCDMPTVDEDGETHRCLEEEPHDVHRCCDAGCDYAWKGTWNGPHEEVSPDA